MKKLFLALSLLVAFTQFSMADEANSANDFLKVSLEGVVTTLKDNPDLLHNNEKMEAYVTDSILTLFDIELISKSIVGDLFWTKASADDQGNLISEMSVFFSRLISKTLSDFDNQTLAFDEAKASSDNERVTIKGRLLDKKDETVAFNFRLIKHTSSWKIYDVNVGGVDLIYTYRSNFKSTLDEGGVTRLAEELHKKNLAVAATKK